MNKVPHVFAAALLRRPFVTLLNSMTDPSLPMTAHEYDEWGDPADAEVVAMWAQLSPHKQIRHARYDMLTLTYTACEPLLSAMP
jgi:protease II